jgi:Ca2+-binding RTX toxin-like protein
VNGFMAPGRQAGCRVTQPRVRAICPTANADAIEVDTGPNPDLIEVLERMPFPVTVHLGAGSDKFIGSGERDTCYPEATRRNRCIGGGGNDLCIAGPQNTDCVGGPGNDTCIESTGSDGCWGDTGNDLCEMGPGEDGCHGGPGNDRLFGGPGADQLYGGPGFDYCDGGPGVGRSHNCEAGPRH